MVWIFLPEAFAMAMAKATGRKIQTMYLISDLSVLALALTYIPMERILYSLLTVVLSGQIVGWIQKVRIPEPADAPEIQPAQ